MPAAGVPASVAVPLPLSVNEMPPGREPVSVKVEAGKPLVVTEKVPAEPTVNVALAALVIAGGCPTMRMKDCVAFGATPLLAVIVVV